MKRTCGDCAECCKVLGVPGLKESHCDCPHMKARGTNRCQIYTDPAKPEVCGTYRCMWLDGLLAGAEKPDRIGLVLTARDDPDGYVLVMAHETRPGTAQHGRGKVLLEQLARGVVVVVVPHDNGKRRVICYNPEIVKKLRPKLAQLGVRT